MKSVLWPNATIIGGWAVLFTPRKYIFVRIVVLIRNGIAHLCRWVGKESNIGQYWTTSCTCGGWALGRVQCVYNVLGVARAKTSPVGG